MLSFYLALLEEENDKIKFRYIYNKYKCLMGKFAFSITKDRQTAIDAVTNAFISIAKNIDSFPDKSNPRHEKDYVYMVVKHAAIDLVRKREKLQKIIWQKDMDYIQTDETPFDEFVGNEGVHDIIKCIESMPETYKDILKFKYVFDMSNAQIAQALGIPQNTVKVKCTRGKVVLHEILKQRGLI